MIADNGHAPEILSRLDGVRKTSDGWQARCPAHDDQNASLSISIGDGGRTLTHCHAGCETEDVLRTIGLTLADLMPSENGRARRDGKSSKRIVAEYNYRDENGVLLYQAVRFDPKDFRQRQPKDGGGWAWNMNGVRRVLYRLPELLAADPGATVYVVEGEKDADRLASLGLVSTTNVGGAEKWRKEYSEAIRGRNVVILPDNDEPGRKHGGMVASSAVGVAASVKVIELPDLPEHGDVSDWLDAGGTVEALGALIADTPEATKRNAPKRSHENRVVVSAEATDLRSAAGRTDSANARRLAILYGDDLLWCEPWGKWLAWDGRHWAMDAERRVDALAKDVAEAVWRQTGVLLPALDYGTAKELIAFARMTASAKGISAMQSLARSEPGIPILPEKLDADPWAFNSLNGTLDLRTGQLQPHDRVDLLTKLCLTEYIAGAAGECPLWEQTIDRIFGGNAALCGFVQRLLGASIVGTVIEHILPIFWGDGSNGKGVLLETILDVLGGDFACKINADVLLTTKNDRHPTELADLFGKRLVVASESDDGRRLREGLLKEITGGDTIKARRMREDFWQFRPSHTLILLTNHKPSVRGTDHGIWRRLCLIPFVQKFWDADRGETGPPELKADKQLREKLRPEHAGILRWLVDGCLRWQASGLQEPAEVTTATAEYRAEQDVLGAFLAECCIVDNAYTAKAAAVYESFSEWCEANGEYAVNQRRFGLAMNERGIGRYTNNGTWYRGVGLATEGTEGTEGLLVKRLYARAREINRK